MGYPCEWSNGVLEKMGAVSVLSNTPVLKDLKVTKLAA